MKTRSTRIITGLLTGLIAVASLLAQTKPEYDMGTMQMVFLSRSTGFKAGTQAEQIRQEHRAYVETLITHGKLALAGEISGEEDLREIVVVKTESLGPACRSVFDYWKWLTIRPGAPHPSSG